MRAEQSRAEHELTGFPSIDKSWMKYYNQECFNVENLPECSLFKYLYENNQHNLDVTALNFFGNKMTYGQMFEEIEYTAKAFMQLGIKPGDVVAVAVIIFHISILSGFCLQCRKILLYRRIYAVWQPNIPWKGKFQRRFLQLWAEFLWTGKEIPFHLSGVPENC